MGLCIFLVLAFVPCMLASQSHYMDMSVTLKQGEMAGHPIMPPFNLTVDFAGKVRDGIPWLAYNQFAMGEHIGTHVDAPYHIAEHGMKLHQIPLRRLRGPAVVIDITERVQRDNESTVNVDDLLEWESKYGQIPSGAWVLMNSGWDQYWPDQMKYVGTDVATGRFSFPGFSPEAATWLVENRPDFTGLGSDTISCDNGKETTLGTNKVHHVLMPNEKMCAELLYNVGKIPESGAMFYMMPIKIYEGTGAPSRAFAMWGEHAELPSAGSRIEMGAVLYCVLSMFTMIVALR